MVQVVTKTRIIAPNPNKLWSEKCQGNWTESGGPAEGRMIWLVALGSMLSKGER